jgi:hypothetical protein
MNKITKINKLKDRKWEVEVSDDKIATKKYKCDVCGKYYEKPMVVIECANCYIKGWKKEFKRT